MTPSEPSSKLPAWIFYASDLVLLAAAVFIAARSSQPLPTSAIFGITACVIAGAILATIPRLVAYEQEKNATLDERQAALEGLSETLTNSAEQISAAATGLHAIAEISQKNLRQAEHLPHKLQDKIAEFQAQLANVTDSEKEELEKELVALRSSESERLESVSDRIAKLVAELSRLETALQAQLKQMSASITQAAASPPSATPRAGTSIAASNKEALPESPTARSMQDAPSTQADATAHWPGSGEKSEISVTSLASRRSKDHHHTPKEFRPTKESLPPHPESPIAATAVVKLRPTTLPVVVAIAAAMQQIPDEAEPGSLPKPGQKRSSKAGSVATMELPELGLDLPTEDPTGVSAAPAPPSLNKDHSASETTSKTSGISSDGATRLTATAYIGIGNRLFIRGEGPGLSWEKGVPLQFVSIGKWRWETLTATTPILYKLYKNDAAECPSLGLQTLSPGVEAEITTSF